MSEIFSSPYSYAVIISIAAFIAAYGSNRINKQRNKTAEQTANIVETANTTLGELQKASENINLSLKVAELANSKLKDNNESIVENLQKTIEAKEATIKSKEEVTSLQIEKTGEDPLTCSHCQTKKVYLYTRLKSRHKDKVEIFKRLILNSSKFRERKAA